MHLERLRSCVQRLPRSPSARTRSPPLVQVENSARGVVVDGAGARSCGKGWQIASGRYGFGRRDDAQALQSASAAEIEPLCRQTATLPSFSRGAGRP